MNCETPVCLIVYIYFDVITNWKLIQKGVLGNLTKYDIIPPFYSCVTTKWLNINYYSIPAYCNTYSYYTVIIIIMYQTCLIFMFYVLFFMLEFWVFVSSMNWTRLKIKRVKYVWTNAS